VVPGSIPAREKAEMIKNIVEDVKSQITSSKAGASAL